MGQLLFYIPCICYHHFLRYVSYLFSDKNISSFLTPYFYESLLKISQLNVNLLHTTLCTRNGNLKYTTWHFSQCTKMLPSCKNGKVSRVRIWMCALWLTHPLPDNRNHICRDPRGLGSHYSLYAFTHYLVHSLFGWELGQLVFIAKKGV